MPSTLRITTEPDGIVILWMDVPGKSVNTCSPEFLADLTDAIATIERDKPRAVIITSAKARSFCAGADLFELRKMNHDQIADYLAQGQALFQRIAQLHMATVAAINGDCLGGGCELALACRYRVAADDFAISIGLPEVKLGLIPAWGGTNRLPRIIGLTAALPILLAGKTMPPRHAQRAGIVDEVVRPEALLAAARRIAGSEPAIHQPSFFNRMLAKIPAARRRVLNVARHRTMRQTRGHYPAPVRLLDTIATGYNRGFAAGLEAERGAVLDASESDAGQNLLRLFFLRQNARRQAVERNSSKPRDVRYAAVVGGGTMGSGIIHALIRADIQVRLIEVDPAAISAALGRIKRLLDADVSAGRIDRLAARHAFNRVSPSAEWTGLELADFVIEAVVETLPAKREVFSRLDRLARPAAVLATNTSSLLVSDIAEATLHPERVVGMHFFNPVSKMPLVEVVKGAHSDNASLATAIALTGRIGKTPIVVNDAPGFLVNRILIPYLAEALVMVSEGRSVQTIDEAMKDWGMPMGPFELLDEIGLDIAAHVLESLAGKGTPQELREPIARITRAAIELKALGRKTGQGFYLYPAKSKRGAQPALNEPFVSAVAASAQSALAPEEIQWRLVLPMVNESVRVLDERVTDSTDTIDLATVMGLGLAPFRGGLVRFANTVGTQAIARRLNELASKYGPRFAPAPLLQDMASANQPIGSTIKETPAAQTPTLEHHHANI